MATHADAVQALLATISGSHFRITDKEMVQIEAHRTAEDALKTLRDAGITSAPVYELVPDPVRPCSPRPHLTCQ
jgi:hypothetical protein